MCHGAWLLHQQLSCKMFGGFIPLLFETMESGITRVHADGAGIAPLILKRRWDQRERVVPQVPMSLSCSETVVLWSIKFVTWQPDSLEVCWHGLVLESLFRVFSQHYLSMSTINIYEDHLILIDWLIGNVFIKWFYKIMFVCTEKPGRAFFWNAANQWAALVWGE